MRFGLEQLQARRFREEAGEGGEGGSGGVDLEALQATVAEQQAEIERLRNHADKVLTETKAAKKAKREAEELAQREAEEKAKKEQDFEQLHRSSEAKRAELEEQLHTLQGKIASEKKSATAMQLAAQLAEGDNATLLSTFIEQRLKYDDDQVHVLSSSGELTVSSLDDLKKEFQNDARYAALLKGNQSSGGGAQGGKTGSGAAKTMTREEFDGTPPADRMKFVKSGGIVTE